MSFEIHNPIDDGITMEQIMETINESEDLVVALESVAAMYGIPSTNILSNPISKNIRVEGDTIIAPPITNVSGNAKAIIQSIGAVLDYVSQRVDDKLDGFQSQCIKKNKLKEHISKEANPSKGQVIARHVDDNGNEIFVYDSGLVDAPMNETSRKYVKKLKDKGLIPDCKDEPCADPHKLTYFTDEDDITIGTSLHESAKPIMAKNFKNYENNPLTEELGDEAPEPVGTKVDIGGGVSADEVDMEENVNESANILDMLTRYNNTRNLGYEIMMEQGIDFVKPVIYQEADENKKVSVADVSYMKFDNKHILAAVKLINEIRSEYKEPGRIEKINYFELVNHPKFNKAISELAQQFDCKLTFRVLTGKKGPGNAATPIIDDEVKHKISISKSKGFQLNGLPISIVTYNSFIEKSVPDDPSLFGQYFVSIMCHEIFHNISSALRVLNTSINACVAAGMDTASKAKDPKAKVAIIGNMVDTLGAMDGININPGKKKKLIADLTLVSIFGKVPGKKDKKKAEDKEDKNKVNDSKEDKKDKKESKEKTMHEHVDSQIKSYKKTAKKLDFAHETRPIYNLGSVVGVALGLIGAASGGTGLTVAGLILSGGGLIGNIVRSIKSGVEKKKYEAGDIQKRKGGNIKNNEEFYCDMFAGMYGLPVTFFEVNTKKRKYVANDLRTDQLKSLYEAEKTWANSLRSPYPVTTERNYAAVKIAKSTLNNKKDIDPAVRKYLEWIVDNYSSVEKLGIDSLYNKSTFDPASAENLDHHLRKLISDNNITVTEYDLSWMDEYDEGDELI